MQDTECISAFLETMYGLCDAVVVSCSILKMPEQSWTILPNSRSTNSFYLGAQPCKVPMGANALTRVLIHSSRFSPFSPCAPAAAGLHGRSYANGPSVKPSLSAFKSDAYTTWQAFRCISTCCMWAWHMRLYGWNRLKLLEIACSPFIVAAPSVSKEWESDALPRPPSFTLLIMVPALHNTVCEDRVPTP